MRRFSLLQILLLSLQLFFFSCQPERTDQPFRAEKGVLDLRTWPAERNILISLDGEWEFYRNVFIDSMESGTSSAAEKHYFVVPGTWEKSGYEAEGYGTFRLTLQIDGSWIGKQMAFAMPPVNSAYYLWINGKMVLQSGQPSGFPSNHSAGFSPQLVVFEPDAEKIEILMHVSNYGSAWAGIYRSISFGSSEIIQEMKKNRLAADLFCIGLLVIMGFYHLMLYFFRKTAREYLFFGVLSLSFATFFTISGEMYYTAFFTITSAKGRLFADLLVNGISLISLVYFIFFLFPGFMNRWFAALVSALAALIVLIFMLVPVSFYQIFSRMVIFFLLTVFCYIFYVYMRALSAKAEGAILSFAGMVFLFASAINQADYLFSPGIILFIVFQSVVLAGKVCKTFNSREKLFDTLTKTCRIYSKFVPVEFLTHLGRESVSHVALSQQSQKNMTVLFADIRNFTALSEKMSSQQNFNFINSYLKRIGPIIRDNKGFIDKYIGDGIMALFPDDPEDAVRAAIAIHREVRTYNNQRKKQAYEAVKVGIGIHTGEIMLGIIGEEMRFDSTVISDNVNLASRMEVLTKTYSVSLIISEDTLYGMTHYDDFTYRFLGKAKFKGKDEYISIFEIFDSDDNDTKLLKMITKDDFEEGLIKYFENQFETAHQMMTRVVTRNKNDFPALYYLRKIEEKMGRGTVSHEENE